MKKKTMGNLCRVIGAMLFILSFVISYYEVTTYGKQSMPGYTVLSLKNMRMVPTIIEWVCRLGGAGLFFAGSLWADS